MVFVKTVKDWKLLTISAKSFILDVSQGFLYAPLYSMFLGILTFISYCSYQRKAQYKKLLWNSNTESLQLGKEPLTNFGAEF